ncbi:Acyltransferase 3 domain-containing protein [Tumidithrix helvetica PCC 7403]|uniref:acyltransferase family protein n=1 Tax=Tumidithrix helvetica TaxID=3457545 RepID=UPI003CC197E7
MTSKTSSQPRIEWLDMLRALCAIEIAGHHWLRACLHVHLFENTSVSKQFRNFIWSYKNNNAGTQLFQNFPNPLLLDSQNSFSAALTNFTGFLFGFGWEAVNVFILLSGFSLALGLGDWPERAKEYWMGWYKRRLKRILFPYYLIAGILLFSYIFIYLGSSLPFFDPVRPKIQEKIGKGWLELLVSQVFLISPWQSSLKATFFSPAWWFIPAIIVAYLFFPFFFWILAKFGSKALLGFTFLVSTVSYWLSAKGVPVEENALYHVILFESFNFTLGMVLGRWFSQPAKRAKLEALVSKPIAIAVGVLLVLAGNLMNWFEPLYPLSSIFFTSGLVIVGINISNLFLGIPIVSKLKKIDSYMFYLIHQLLAYIIALVLSYILRAYTTSLGILIYFAAVLLATSIFLKFYLWLEGKALLWLQNRKPSTG